MNFLVSIVIPTKNPGSIFQEVIYACCKQKTSFSYEIIIIDSGTKDGSIEFLSKDSDFNKVNIRIYKILPEEFGHGKTRNYAISLSSAEYIAMITQDALPANDYWLQNLVKIIQSDTKIAGVFGRHKAYPNASLYNKRNIDGLFDLIKSFGKYYSYLNKDQLKKNSKDFSDLHYYFSDNNALIKKTVWESIPYPNVEFAEDQIWAKKIIESGFIKAYADEAIVYHSHNYGIIESFQRTFDEAKAKNILFGIKPIKSIKYFFGSPIKAILRDSIYYIKYRNKSKSDLYWFLRMPVDHLLRVLALFIGQNHKSIPNKLLRYLSRDHRLYLS